MRTNIYDNVVNQSDENYNKGSLLADIRRGVGFIALILILTPFDGIIPTGILDEIIFSLAYVLLSVILGSVNMVRRR